MDEDDFFLYGWFDSQGPRAPTAPIFLVIAKNPKHMVPQPSLGLLLFIFTPGCGRFTGRALGVPSTLMNPFPVTRNAFWLFGKHLTEDEEAAEWEGVLKCKETSKLLMELRCRGVWKAHPPLLGAGKKEMEP